MGKKLIIKGANFALNALERADRTRLDLENPLLEMALALDKATAPSDTLKGKLFDISSYRGQVMTINASVTSGDRFNLQYALLASMPTMGSNVQYIPNTNTIMTSRTKVEILIPQTASYLYLTTFSASTNPNNVEPTSVTFASSADSMSLDLTPYVNARLNTSTPPSIIADSSSQKGELYDISPYVGKEMTIVANSQASLGTTISIRYAFLKDIAYVTSSSTFLTEFATGGSVVTAKQTESVTIDVPSDARGLFVMVYNSSVTPNDVKPQSISFV